MAPELGTFTDDDVTLACEMFGVGERVLVYLHRPRLDGADE